MVLLALNLLICVEDDLIVPNRNSMVLYRKGTQVKNTGKEYSGGKRCRGDTEIMHGCLYTNASSRAHTHTHTGLSFLCSWGDTKLIIPFVCVCMCCLGCCLSNRLHKTIYNFTFWPHKMMQSAHPHTPMCVCVCVCITNC